MNSEQSIEKHGKLFNLENLEQECWTKIYQGSQHTKDPFHQPAFGTVGNGMPCVRTVVLRKAFHETATLHVHTDVRSRKFNEIIQNPQVSFLFYNFENRIQIRVNAKATLHTDDDVAEKAWAETGLNSRKTYMITQAPSSVTMAPSNGLEEKFISNDPSQDESQSGRENFCLVVAKVHTMDWLWLNSKGHRRAIFSYEADRQFSAQWLIP